MNEKKRFESMERDILEGDEDVCEWCDGTGVIATDEEDGEGHTMRGVGEGKCICQIDQ